MAKQTPEIRYINYGIGFTVEDNGQKWIELNKHLKKYPDLHTSVLNHELKHYYNGTNRFDFMIELKDMFKSKDHFKLLAFQLKHPKSFACLLPFMYKKTEGFAWNSYMCAVWTAILLIAIMGGILIWTKELLQV